MTIQAYAFHFAFIVFFRAEIIIICSDHPFIRSGLVYVCTCAYIVILQILYGKIRSKLLLLYYLYYFREFSEGMSLQRLLIWAFFLFNSFFPGYFSIIFNFFTFNFIFQQWLTYVAFSICCNMCAPRGQWGAGWSLSRPMSGAAAFKASLGLARDRYTHSSFASRIQLCTSLLPQQGLTCV